MGILRLINTLVFIIGKCWSDWNIDDNWMKKIHPMAAGNMYPTHAFFRMCFGIVAVSDLLFCSNNSLKEPLSSYS